MPKANRNKDGKFAPAIVEAVRPLAAEPLTAEQQYLADQAEARKAQTEAFRLREKFNRESNREQIEAMRRASTKNPRL